MHIALILVAISFRCTHKFDGSLHRCIPREQRIREEERHRGSTCDGPPVQSTRCSSRPVVTYVYTCFFLQDIQDD